jgi:hypothetical protein
MAKPSRTTNLVSANTERKQVQSVGAVEGTLRNLDNERGVREGKRLEVGGVLIKTMRISCCFRHS